MREVLAQTGPLLLEVGPPPPAVVLGTAWSLYKEAHPDRLPPGAEKQTALN